MRVAGVDCRKTREGDMSGSISIPVLESAPPRDGVAFDTRGALPAMPTPQKLSGMFPVMDISTNRHQLPYMGMAYPYMEVSDNLR